jgi:hypothetical protein
VTQLVFKEFDKPVRVTQHPKFTVALGAATVAVQNLNRTAPVAPPPVVEPAELPERNRRRWLVPASAAAILVVVATLVAALIIVSDDGQAVDAAANTRTDDTAESTTTEAPKSATEPPSTAAAPATGSAQSSVSSAPPAAEPLSVFGNKLVSPYRAFIASPEKWDGTELVGNAASHTAISATIKDGLRVTWHGGAPGQVYLQTVNASRDLSRYVDDNGALQFSVFVHSTGNGTTSIATHCGYPCSAELNVTELFHNLPVGKQKRVTIPLACFTENGLNKTMVNTPFLVYAQGPLDVTFRDVRWVPGAADAPDATPCSALS